MTKRFFKFMMTGQALLFHEKVGKSSLRLFLTLHKRNNILVKPLIVEMASRYYPGLEHEALLISKCWERSDLCAVGENGGHKSSWNPELWLNLCLPDQLSPWMRLKLAFSSRHSLVVFSLNPLFKLYLREGQRRTHAQYLMLVWPWKVKGQGFHPLCIFG